MSYPIGILESLGTFVNYFRPFIHDMPESCIPRGLTPLEEIAYWASEVAYYLNCLSEETREEVDNWEHVHFVLNDAMHKARIEFDGRVDHVLHEKGIILIGKYGKHYLSGKFANGVIAAYIQRSRLSPNIFNGYIVVRAEAALEYEEWAEKRENTCVFRNPDTSEVVIGFDTSGLRDEDKYGNRVFCCLKPVTDYVQDIIERTLRIAYKQDEEEEQT